MSSSGQFLLAIYDLFHEAQSCAGTITDRTAVLLLADFVAEVGIETPGEP